MTKKYLMNGFGFQLRSFEKYLKEYDFTYLFPKPHKYDFVSNYLLYRKWQKTGKIKEYDVIHINNWENFLNFKKIKGQLAIGESHGFHLGANFNRFLIDEDNILKRSISRGMEFFLSKKIREKINEFDMYYCSTPDMIKSLREQVRSDIIWLPNCIDTNFFTPHGPKVKLKGNPAVFFPTRLHADKKPEIGINIFRDYIKKEFPEATLHFIKQPFNDQYNHWKKELSDSKTYFWDINFLPQPELVKYYRGADLIMGGFSIGACGLMELEAIACGTPVLVNDKYELNTKVDDLPKLALNILGDKKFREKYIHQNREYVVKTHGERAVSEQHRRNIKKLGY